MVWLVLLWACAPDEPIPEAPADTVDTGEATTTPVSTGPHDLVDGEGDSEGALDLRRCTVSLSPGQASASFKVMGLPASVTVDAAPAGVTELVFEAAFDLDADPTTGCDGGLDQGAEVVVSAEHISTGDGPRELSLVEALAGATGEHVEGCTFRRVYDGAEVVLDGDTLSFVTPLDRAPDEATQMFCFIQQLDPASSDLVP